MITDKVKIPFRCYFVHHKSHMGCPGIDPGVRDENLATKRLRGSLVTEVLYFFKNYFYRHLFG